MARPDFLCIGAQKAGTSWLYRMLSQNESLFLPPIKEIHFFDYIYINQPSALGRRRLREAGEGAVAKAGVPRLFPQAQAADRTTDAWYAAVFAHPKAKGRIAGEITPAYSFLPAAGVRRVRAINRDLKILFIIRDPVDRALSHLRMLAGRGKWDGVGEDTLERPRMMEARSSAAPTARTSPAGRRSFRPSRSSTCRTGGSGRSPRRCCAGRGLRRRQLLELRPAWPPTCTSRRRSTIEPAVVAALEAQLGDERAWLRARFGRTSCSPARRFRPHERQDHLSARRQRRPEFRGRADGQGLDRLSVDRLSRTAGSSSTATASRPRRPISAGLSVARGCRRPQAVLQPGDQGPVRGRRHKPARLPRGAALRDRVLRPRPCRPSSGARARRSSCLAPQRSTSSAAATSIPASAPTRAS